MAEIEPMRSIPPNDNNLLIFSTQDAENQRHFTKWRLRLKCQFYFQLLRKQRRCGLHSN
jgi:hypothetical protein